MGVRHSSHLLPISVPGTPIAVEKINSGSSQVNKVHVYEIPLTLAEYDSDIKIKFKACCAQNPSVICNL